MTGKTKRQPNDFVLSFILTGSNLEPSMVDLSFSNINTSTFFNCFQKQRVSLKSFSLTILVSLTNILKMSLECKN